MFDYNTLKDTSFLIDSFSLNMLDDSVSGIEIERGVLTKEKIEEILNSVNKPLIFNKTTAGFIMFKTGKEVETTDRRRVKFSSGDTIYVILKNDGKFVYYKLYLK